MAYISFDPKNDPLKKEPKTVKPLGQKWRRRFIALLIITIIEQLIILKMLWL